MSRKPKQLIAAAIAASLIGGAVAAGQGEHGHHHHHFPADVDALHGVLAPVWHADRGAERNRDACARAGRMAGLAQAIRSTDAARLQASLATLAKTCTDGKGDVERALFDVHEEFHRLIEPRKGA